jgi:hypothetical protein
MNWLRPAALPGVRAPCPPAGDPPACGPLGAAGRQAPQLAPPPCPPTDVPSPLALLPWCWVVDRGVNSVAAALRRAAGAAVAEEEPEADAEAGGSGVSSARRRGHKAM